MGWTWNSKNALQKMVSANKSRTRFDAKELDVIKLFTYLNTVLGDSHYFNSQRNHSSICNASTIWRLANSRGLSLLEILPMRTNHICGFDFCGWTKLSKCVTKDTWGSELCLKSGTVGLAGHQVSYDASCRQGISLRNLSTHCHSKLLMRSRIGWSHHDMLELVVEDWNAFHRVLFCFISD